MRFIFKYLGAVWPGLIAQAVYRNWFRTPRYPEPKREIKWRQLAINKMYSIAGQSISVYRWGACTPGYVLLMHGWSGRGTQLGGFVNTLNALGLGVLCFDAPGHGLSDGNSTNIYQIANIVNELSAQHGAPKAIVAHSFGGMAAALAIQKYQLSVDKLITISCPMDSYILTAGYKQYLRLNDRVMKRFEEKLFTNLSASIYEDTSVELNLKQHPVEVLIVHDKDDTMVPWRQSEKISQAIPCKTLFTSGLGHMRILRDKVVIEHIAQFIKS